MRLVVDAEHINEPQADTIRKLWDTLQFLLRNSYEIDILIHKRKDSVDTYFQADWLKYMRVEE
jgi:hypothetical protein